MWKPGKWDVPCVVSDSTLSLVPLGENSFSVFRIVPLVSVSVLPLLTRNLDSSDILKNVYFDFAFRLNNFSVDIADF